MAVAADCPSTYDCVINGQGYMLDTSYDDSPFRKPPAQYSYTPTFLERTNVSGNYGDDAQAFFLTASQNDWSLGEGRKYFRSTDPDGIRRFWSGTAIDTSVPGQVTIAKTTAAVTFGTAVSVATEAASALYAAGTTNLYQYPTGGTVNDLGTHGLGAAPRQWGIASDNKNVYLSTTAAGTVGVIKWNGSVFSTFSATPADSLAFLNNVLYGYQQSTGSLIQYSTSGVASTIFTWQDAAGVALTGSSYATRLRPYGGVLTILRRQGGRGCGELWQFDGTATDELGAFPENFIAWDMEIVSGVILVSGYTVSGTDVLLLIFYYVSGQIGQLWQSLTTGPITTMWPPVMAAYGNGVAFNDDTTGRLMQYNIALGGVCPFGTYTVAGAPMLAANRDALLHTRGGTAAYAYPGTGATASTGTLTLSLFDFDNSRPKLTRGIQVEFDAATDGDGGSIDIAYQFESVTGTFTNLKTGASSGIEYALPSTSCHAIGVKVTLNKGTSTHGPVLKRVYARAAPELQSYRTNTYLLDLSGNKKATNPGYIQLVNGSTHTKDGDEMRADLVTAIAAGPISVTDRFGTFTATIEPSATTFREVRSDYGRAEYRAEIAVREI